MEERFAHSPACPFDDIPFASGTVNKEKDSLFMRVYSSARGKKSKKEARLEEARRDCKGDRRVPSFKSLISLVPSVVQERSEQSDKEPGTRESIQLVRIGEGELIPLSSSSHPAYLYLVQPEGNQRATQPTNPFTSLKKK